MAGSGLGDALGENDPGPGSSGAPRNPLTCGVCHDYFNDPCLLSCFHTFCARCIRGPHVENKISCPTCGQMTQLKDGAVVPPVDQLMRQLVELANSENPPCANCDKRDKSGMFFCITCGQALCTLCREPTHRAKMFSSHEVVHMSKCAKDSQRRCSSHGELYIMYSQSAKCMLCATCFRETPAEARLHCVDIESAWQQASKKMERTANHVCQLQADVRDNLLAFKSQLEELRRSIETEKKSLSAYCQGMQEVVNKTHAVVSSELQRQFETKERTVRAQLLSLGSALPVLQMHLMLCTVFTSGATKHQFLELAHPMLERLDRVAQLGRSTRPPLLTVHLRTNYRNDFARALQPYVGQTIAQKESMYDHGHASTQDPLVLQSVKTSQRGAAKAGLGGGQSQDPSGPFSNHCRTFDSQLKELSQQLMAVKERLGELHRDVAVLRRANTPPLGSRYEHVARDCKLLEQQLERHQIELERLGNIFDALWEEQLCKIHVEKEIFHSQMNDIVTLRGEVKQLQNLTQQLEPFVKSFSAGVNAGERRAAATDSSDQQHLDALLDHLARLQMQESQQQPPPSPPPPPPPQTAAPTKDCRHSRSSATSADNALYIKEAKETPTSGRTPLIGVGALLDSGGNIVVYGTTKSSDVKRGVLSQLIEKTRPREGRKKSPGREEGARDRSQSRRSRKSPDNPKPKTPPGGHGGGKVRTLYRTLTGGGGSAGTAIADAIASGGQEQITEQSDRCAESQQRQTQSAGAEESEYQRISEASTLSEAKKSRVQAQVHAVPTDDNQQPTTPKSAKSYPMSDPEDVFYSIGKSRGPGSSSASGRRRRRASCDSLSTTGSGNSPRSSIADGTVLGQTGGTSQQQQQQQQQQQDTRKALLVLFGTPPGQTGSAVGKAAASLVQKQRSWETFPRPKSKRGGVNPAVIAAAESNATGLGQLKKADSFEGHEEAVRTLVAAVQETRSHHRHHHAHHHHRYHRKSKTN